MIIIMTLTNKIKITITNNSGDHVENGDHNDHYLGVHDDNSDHLFNMIIIIMIIIIMIIIFTMIYKITKQ